MKLLPSLSLGFRHEERERDTHNFSMLTVSSDPTDGHACTTQSTNCTGLAQVRKINLRRSNLNSLLLFKITKNPIASGHDVIHIPSYISIWGFYCDICDCHTLPACVCTPALTSAPTHAQSRTVLSLTKLKDKIYKTKNDNIKKSFRSYLPQLWVKYIHYCP